MKRKQASLLSQLTDSESRAGRYAGLFEVATDGALELAQKRYVEILNGQGEIRHELKLIEDKIASTFNYTIAGTAIKIIENAIRD